MKESENQIFLHLDNLKSMEFFAILGNPETFSAMTMAMSIYGTLCVLVFLFAAMFFCCKVFFAAMRGEFRKGHPLPGNFLHKFGKFSLFASWPKSHKYLVVCAWKILFAILGMFFFSPKIVFSSSSIKRFVAVEKTVPAGGIWPWSCAKTHCAGETKEKPLRPKTNNWQMVPFECCIFLVFCWIRGMQLSVSCPDGGFV